MKYLTAQLKATKIANATKSKVNLGFGADDIRPAANAVDFLKANPKVEKMLKSFDTSWRYCCSELEDEQG